MYKPGSSSTAQVQPTPLIDPYRTLPALLRKPTLQFIPAGSENEHPQLSEALGIEPLAYSARLANKQVLLAQLHLAPLPASTSSSSNPYALPELYRVDQLKPKQLPLGSDGGLENPVKGRKKHAGDPRLLHQKRMESRQAEKKRKKTGLLGRQAAKELGVWDVKGKGKATISYDSLIPLNELHTSYLSALFNTPPMPDEPLDEKITFASAALPSAESYQGKLVKADFTGCILRVKEAKNKDLKGIQGIVVQETSGCFKLVTTKDQVKVVPKNNSLFLISFPAYSTAPGDMRPIPTIEIDLLGSAFCFRTGDRAGRKFKIGGAGNGWGDEWVVGSESYLAKPQPILGSVASAP